MLLTLIYKQRSKEVLETIKILNTQNKGLRILIWKTSYENFNLKRLVALIFPTNHLLPLICSIILSYDIKKKSKYQEIP